MQEARRRPARRNPREVHAAGRAARLSPRTSGLDVSSMTAISLSVAAIPEGLPTILTVTLAIGVQRMARRNAIAPGYGLATTSARQPGSRYMLNSTAGMARPTRNPWMASHSSARRNVKLLVGLNPLRDHDYAEGVGQLDRGAHDRVGIPVAAEACHEGPVDLDLVDRKPPELS